MNTPKELEAILQRIHKKGYPAYKDTTGSYNFGDYILDIAHVQSDPFASPSRIQIMIPAEYHGFSKEYYMTYHRRVALCDLLLRLLNKAIAKEGRQAKGSGKSGLISVSRCCAKVLERTACQIDTKTGMLTVRILVGFPANGRTIDAYALKHILFEQLPSMIHACLYQKAVSKGKVESVIFLADDQNYIRDQLSAKDLCAFVANGSILPRESGVSERPLNGAVPFVSPDSQAVTLSLPHYGKITGMGIRKGITVIAGGGYHGKSTLLHALEAGVYNHIAGDGREYVITDESAMKIRSEDGRSIKELDISLFMDNLPGKTDTHRFTTENASGSTSQAANVMEAIEGEAKLLLIDEDTSATNFMIRDELMQQVISSDKEPITTFSERITWLVDKYQLSIILVIGSSGVYFHTADTILQLDYYKVMDITKEARMVASSYPAPIQKIPDKVPEFHRVFGPSKECNGQNRLKLKTTGLDSIFVNHDIIDVRYLEQLVDNEQTTALAHMLVYIEQKLLDGKHTLLEAVEMLCNRISEKGLSSICNGHNIPDMALPRKQEILACLNRYRQL